MATKYSVEPQNFMILIVVLCGLYTVQGMDMKTCKGVDLASAEKGMMHVNACLKEAGAKQMQDVETSKMACFGKCVMVKQGAIDEKGQPHHENIKNMIKADMPAIVHEALNKEMDICLNDDTNGTIDPTDESCTTYLPLMMCMHNAFLEVCS